MNLFRITADLAHAVAIVILILKIWKSRSCEGKILFEKHVKNKTKNQISGISGRSQLLFAVVFFTRYLDLFTSFYSLYNTVMKVFFLQKSCVDKTNVSDLFPCWIHRNRLPHVGQVQGDVRPQQRLFPHRIPCHSMHNLRPYHQPRVHVHGGQQKSQQENDKNFFSGHVDFLDLPGSRRHHATTFYALAHRKRRNDHRSLPFRPWIIQIPLHLQLGLQVGWKEIEKSSSTSSARIAVGQLWWRASESVNELCQLQ